LRLNPEALEVGVKFGPKAGAPPDRLDLIPGGPYDLPPVDLEVAKEFLNSQVARKS